MKTATQKPCCCHRPQCRKCVPIQSRGDIEIRLVASIHWSPQRDVDLLRPMLNHDDVTGDFEAIWFAMLDLADRGIELTINNVERESMRYLTQQEFWTLFARIQDELEPLERTASEYAADLQHCRRQEEKIRTQYEALASVASDDHVVSHWATASRADQIWEAQRAAGRTVAELEE